MKFQKVITHSSAVSAVWARQYVAADLPAVSQHKQPVAVQNGLASR